MAEASALPARRDSQTCNTCVDSGLTLDSVQQTLARTLSHTKLPLSFGLNFLIPMRNQQPRHEGPLRSLGPKRYLPGVSAMCLFPDAMGLAVPYC